jgi:hypothetical protein
MMNTPQEQVSDTDIVTNAFLEGKNALVQKLGPEFVHEGTASFEVRLIKNDVPVVIKTRLNTDTKIIFVSMPEALLAHKFTASNDKDPVYSFPTQVVRLLPDRNYETPLRMTVRKSTENSNLLMRFKVSHDGSVRHFKRVMLAAVKSADGQIDTDEDGDDSDESRGSKPDGPDNSDD